MSFFVQSTIARTPKTKNSRAVAVALAGVMIVLALAQLFTFEDFPDVIAGFWLAGGAATATAVAAVLVSAEVFAVPFLLSMRLSPAMRVVSMVAGWAVVAIWLALSIWANLSAAVVGSIGFLGATAALPVGWWSVCVFIGIGILTGWASWGMWPFSTTGRVKT